jgi:hypothetical protein
LENFRSRLPAVREELGLSPEDMEIRTSIGAKRIKAIEEGRQKLKWSEYLSIVFGLWSSETGRTILEEKELFPEELRRAMSVNRNAHD